MTQPFNPFAQQAPAPAAVAPPTMLAPQGPQYVNPATGQPYAPPTVVAPNYYPPALPPATPGQPYYPPAPPVGANPYAGADSAPAIVRTPNIPLGQHDLEVVKYERAITGSGEFVFITFNVAQSNASPVGTQCAFKQNMNPAAKGGKNIAFSALKSVIFPILGFDLSDPKVTTICEQGLFSQWLLELETKGTVAGQPFAGRHVYCVANPTPPKPEQLAKGHTQGFPQISFMPKPA